MLAHSIRQFDACDAAAVTVLMHASVHAAGGRGYTPRQLAAWSPRAMAPEAFLARVSDGRIIRVAETLQGRLVGFAELVPSGHIDCFYCHPAGQGVGRGLYLSLEAWAKARKISSLTVEASEGARPFFLRMGFTFGERREICRNGVMLHNWAMAKPLP